MPEWSRFAAASASTRNRLISFSDAKRPPRIILTATIRLSRMCRALYTTPMPPRAISSSNSYSPNRPPASNRLSDDDALSPSAPAAEPWESASGKVRAKSLCSKTRVGSIPLAVSDSRADGRGSGLTRPSSGCSPALTIDLPVGPASQRGLAKWLPYQNTVPMRAFKRRWAEGSHTENNPTEGLPWPTRPILLKLPIQPNLQRFGDEPVRQALIALLAVSQIGLQTTSLDAGRRCRQRGCYNVCPTRPCPTSSSATTRQSSPYRGTPPYQCHVSGWHDGFLHIADGIGNTVQLAHDDAVGKLPAGATDIVCDYCHDIMLEFADCPTMSPSDPAPSASASTPRTTRYYACYARVKFTDRCGNVVANTCLRGIGNTCCNACRATWLGAQRIAQNHGLRICSFVYCNCRP